MSRSRGDWPKTLIDEKYPFQVVIHLTDWHRTNLVQLIHDRQRLGGYRLDGSAHHEGHYFSIVRLPTEESQTEFIRLYGGVPYDPTDKKSKPWESYFDR
ncbi:hypothetical protein ATN84_01705 [Paramesorhizobium deserti]|uniref:Uncharacterized protein n=1 Tax=Paramesorhizobium deserti TaxID=1494590 RepID=A0A135HZE2_9HYPH|nr:hypothetical protein [Paramesorhizobium deserti]KXF78533.1 hypothetical protein ATN84_01705 [Paramesorhizobium deserti]